MIALEQARQHLESLGLKQAVEVLDNTLDVAANKQLTYPEMLEQLLGTEVAARRERYLSTRTKMAHFPFQTTREHIFANPMATATAIDRVVHHSVILEFNVPSYRTGGRSRWREV